MEKRKRSVSTSFILVLLHLPRSVDYVINPTIPHIAHITHHPSPPPSPPLPLSPSRPLPLSPSPPLPLPLSYLCKIVVDSCCVVGSPRVRGPRLPRHHHRSIWKGAPNAANSPRVVSPFFGKIQFLLTVSRGAEREEGGGERKEGGRGERGEREEGERGRKEERGRREGGERGSRDVAERKGRSTSALCESRCSSVGGWAVWSW